MKYSDALKIYNEGKPAWCSPRKGSNDYKAVLAIMKGGVSPPKSPLFKKTDVSTKKASSSKSSSPKMVGSSKKPSSKSLLFKKANVIQRFLKNKLILTKNNLDTRVQRYHLIKKRLADIRTNKCLKREIFGSNEGYTIDGIVNLEKKIGEDGAQGAIYLTSMPHMLGTYPIASKVMEINNNNECETQMNEWITENLIIPKQSKHFVIMYKNTKCPFRESIDDTLRKEERLVNYNELCNGDLSALMQTDERNNEMLMMNMAFQALIAIATYQNRVGYCHMDCHHGNFLYQLNNEVGHYHYIYNGFNFYIKSCKYNIFLYDFGISEPMSNVDNTKICDDYIRILYAFMSINNRGWKEQGWIKGKMSINVNHNMTTMSNVLKKILSKNINNTQLDMFQEIIEEVSKVFKKDAKIFTTAKPSKILNKIPFIINKVEEYPKIEFKNKY